MPEPRTQAKDCGQRLTWIQPTSNCAITFSIVLTSINRNVRPNNNQLIVYYLYVHYLLRIQQFPVNTTYNISSTISSVKPVSIKKFQNYILFLQTNKMPILPCKTQEPNQLLHTCQRKAFGKNSQRVAKM